MSSQLQIRRDTLANIQAATPAQGELAMATDTNQLFIGDGATAGGDFIGPSGPAHPGFQSGNYYAAAGMGLTGPPLAVASGTLYASLFYSPVETIFSKIGCNITTGAAGNVRLGVYAANAPSGGAAGTPSGTSLVVDCGAVGTSGTGAAEIAGQTIKLKAGWYWLVANFSATPDATTLGSGAAGLQNWWWGESTIGTSNTVSGATVAQAYGAMPATFPNSAAIATSAGSIPGVWLRL